MKRRRRRRRRREKTKKRKRKKTAFCLYSYLQGGREHKTKANQSVNPPGVLSLDKSPNGDSGDRSQGYRTQGGRLTTK